MTNATNGVSFANFTPATPSQNGDLYKEYEQLLQIIQQMQQDIANHDFADLQKDYALFTQIANSATAYNQYCHEFLASLVSNAKWAFEAAQNGQWDSANEYFADEEATLNASPPGMFSYFIQQMEAFLQEYSSGFTLQQFLDFINANTGPEGYSLKELLGMAVFYLSNRGDGADAQVFQSILDYINNNPPSNAESLTLFIEFLENEFQKL